MRINRRHQKKTSNGFTMLIKSGLHLIIVLIFIFSICAIFANFDRSLEIERRKKTKIKNQNKTINKINMSIQLKLPVPKKILSDNNIKIEKSKALGYRTFGIHLAPYKQAGRNVCSHASAGCIASCLNTSGHGQFDNTQKARTRKTKAFFTNRAKFLERLYNEITNKRKNVPKINKLEPVFRLNLTSDLPWHKIALDHKNEKSIINTFSDLKFYDYTKDLKRYFNFLFKTDSFPDNYHLIFSRSEKTNLSIIKEIIKNGGNVAIPFRCKSAKDLPKFWNDIPVIDGESHDLRFLDPKSKIVGLPMKGKASKDLTGFVQEIS